jgi:3-hydroxyisobutyrate dehydrogenase-like beta-hydroxyacid dehydrogenase
MPAIESLGFIGLGVMGEPMCANLARKSGLPVFATDLRPEPLERLAAAGAVGCVSVADVARQADLVFLSLPSGREVELVLTGDGGVLDNRGRVAAVVDCSTSPVPLTRAIAGRLAAAGIAFADAPVARTREAAQKGELSIMVGGDAALFARLLPLLRTMGTEVTHCGPVGCGQAVKIVNNMVVAETGLALAEALAIGRRAGVDERLLFETLAKGSADSFVLRSHGMKALLPRQFPENAFGADYMLKDLGYALELAEAGGVEAAGAETVRRRLAEASARGFGRNYWPVLYKVVDGGEG